MPDRTPDAGNDGERLPHDAGGQHADAEELERRTKAREALLSKSMHLRISKSQERENEKKKKEQEKKKKKKDKGNKGKKKSEKKRKLS